jgi:hypothetical protein
MRILNAGMPLAAAILFTLSLAGCPQGAKNAPAVDELPDAVSQSLPDQSVADEPAPQSDDLTDSIANGTSEAGAQTGEGNQSSQIGTVPPNTNNTKTPIQGDIDGDGMITTNDLALAEASFGLQGQAPAAADINGNGVIDLYDLAWMLAILSH